MTICARWPNLKFEAAQAAALTLGLSVWAAPASAQRPQEGGATHLRWSIGSVPGPSMRPGARFRATLTASLAPGWHIYALEEPDGGPTETVVALGNSDPASLLHVEQSAPEIATDPAFGRRVALFSSSAVFTLWMQLAKTAPRGVDHLHVSVRYQICSERVCMPPRSDVLDLPVSVGQ